MPENRRQGVTAGSRRFPRSQRPRLARVPARRGDGGETLALLVLWPALIVAILLMLVHAFIVTNARAEAELAASQGLRSAWRAAADADFVTDPNNPPNAYTGFPTHPEVLEMAAAAQDAVAAAAATSDGWRWWTPGAAQVFSDWCGDRDTQRPTRSGGDRIGWVRVTVTGEVFGPMAALWPNRWDRVYAAAQGPALLVAPTNAADRFEIPLELPLC